MRVEVGFYRQRNHLMAEVVGQDSTGKWIGRATSPALLDKPESSKNLCVWGEDGQADGDAVGFDIVAPWTEPVTKEVTVYLFRTPQGDEYVGASMRSHLIIDEKIASARVMLTEGQFAEDTK